MDLYINLKVNFRGNTKSFLLSGSETKSWETVEATVKRSFGLCNLQLTYFDEENEEVSINSQLEYEEALKSAARQGNRLQMNVYETRGTTGRVPGPGPGPALGLAQVKPGTIPEPKKGFRPPQHCPTLAQVVSRKVQAAVPEEGLVTLNELKGVKVEDKTPPAWFTSYMEKFKDQVVREAVEKICREFSGQCCIHKPVGAEAQVPEVSSSTLPGAPSPAPACSSCRGQTAGGGYQCSVCTSCTLCEPCSFSHDPSHNLVRARTPLSIPEHGSPAPDHSRFYRRGDRSFRKAEKQRLKAEKRQLKAEVKEIRKQLRMERRGLQWGSTGDGNSSPVLLQPRATQANSPERPKRPCPLAVPAMTALLLDENLPDGSRLRPGTKFIKYWKMKNSGRMSWSSETKLKFMWGNLAVGSGERWREVPVPSLQPGQVGVVSVTLCAPTLEGTYTSHWRLAHRAEQFGPRVWCSIVVDPHAPAAAISADGLLISPCVTPQEKSARTLEREEKCRAASREQLLITVDQDCDQEFYIPSVDLLTAQDLLSFELLDINIVQELENVPNNTPADITPCISPLPHDGLLQEKLGLIQEEAEVQAVNSILEVTQSPELGGVPAQEKGEENMLGRQFVSESLIRSLTLGEVLEHGVLQGRCPNKVLRPAPQGSVSLCERNAERLSGTSPDNSPLSDPLTEERGIISAPTPTSLKEERGIITAQAPLPASLHTDTDPAPDPTPLLSVPSENVTADEGNESDIEQILVDPVGGERSEEDESESKKKKEEEEEKTKNEEASPLEGKEIRSRTSSASSEDYIIILPDCFDTSRPLGESMYSSALSQPGDDAEDLLDTELQSPSDANSMLCASQTLDSVPLTPVIVAAPKPSAKSSSETVEQGEEPQEPESEDTAAKEQDAEPSSSDPGSSCPADPEIQELKANSITGGLVKGALSVAASAYKALFTGQPGPEQLPEEAATQDAMMAVLVEMGFGDRALNQRLLQKHGRNLLDVVNELVHMQDNDWYSTRY
ncbi:next to BRCA1 gene 1 protein [Hoplias malabaricus]|uniref:next to BRCA1 gene 1 protein n=1 Tax=Hoplias malabaricus TaxID=27720 RepID=UPI003461CC8D